MSDIEWSTTSKQSLGHGVKFMVYGNAGSGKTALVPTLPKPLLISAENGLLSLTRKNIERMHGVNTPGICYDIPVAKINSLEGINKVLSWLDVPSNRSQFSSIAVDSISEIAEVVLAQALKEISHGEAAYGEMARNMVKLCKALRDMEGMHVYFSAKLGFSKQTNMFGPLFPGQVLPPDAPYWLDELFHLKIVKDAEGNDVRVLQTAVDSQYNAKDRSGALDTRGEWPNLSNIIAKISAA